MYFATEESVVDKIDFTCLRSSKFYRLTRAEPIQEKTLHLNEGKFWALTCASQEANV